MRLFSNRDLAGDCAPGGLEETSAWNAGATGGGLVSGDAGAHIAIPLSTLGRGRPARIVAVAADPGAAPDLEDRLLEIGFEEGAEVELLHRGPLGGDPLAVRIDRMTVALRRREAEHVLVEPLS